MGNFFEDALQGRVQEIIDACTRCGKCVEICPVKAPAGVTAPAQEVVSGVIDILRSGDGPEASRRWASTNRGLHRRLRLRRQSAFHAGDGPPRHGQGKHRAARATPAGRRDLPHAQSRGHGPVAHAA